jgi:hypothetical protein
MRPNERYARSIARYVAALVLAAGSTTGFAQEGSYPAKLILLLTPFGPGVGPDLYMRPLSTKLGGRDSVRRCCWRAKSAPEVHWRYCRRSLHRRTATR